MANKIGITPLQEEWSGLDIKFSNEPTHKEFGDTFIRFNRMGKVFEIRIKEVNTTKQQRRK